MATPSFAYLAEGKLVVGRAGQQPEPIDSTFVRGVEERREEHRKRHGWRSSGMVWNTMDEGPELAQMRGMFPTEQKAARFLGVSKGPTGGEILYSLETDAVGGLFQYDIKEGYEQRLVHRQGLHLRDLTRHPVSGQLAGSVGHTDGSASLAVMQPDGARLREVTEGDAVDEAPSWVPGEEETLVYQSAGIGRDHMDGIYGFAPFGIYKLDLANDRMSTVLELPEFDCLAPRITADGSLYYIRRPYQLEPPRDIMRMTKDVLLFPFRLMRAVVHFFHAFSMFFSRKPLITSGGPRREGPDKRRLMIRGRIVEVSRDLADSKNADKPLIPNSWELIRRAPNGDETTIASHVLSYDLCPDGSPIYSNGSAVFHLPIGATKPERLARGRYIEHLTVISD